MISALKIPKLIRWIFSVSVIFLLIMTLLRFGLYFGFGKQGNHFSDVLPAFVLGLRYDLRDVCILALLLMILGSFPALNPFQTKIGKNIAFSLITLASFY